MTQRTYRTEPAEIGRRIRAEREKKTWTQEELAARAPGVTRTTISRMEDGVQLTGKNLKTVARALGVSVVHLTSPPLALVSGTLAPGSPGRLVLEQVARGEVTPDAGAALLESLLQ